MRSSLKVCTCLFIVRSLQSFKGLPETSSLQIHQTTLAPTLPVEHEKQAQPLRRPSSISSVSELSAKEFRLTLSSLDTNESVQH
eukprot:m.21354 g.21354  ORF g.21354 m.21354 type:complete len:84 (-) comp12677_c0_seq2:81-332(-)